MLPQQTHYRIDKKTQYLPGMTFCLHFEITSAQRETQFLTMEKIII